MAIEDRRQRERIARRRLITATARSLAERASWDAVTTRRLSTEIEYSQPVLYKHFGSMDDIVEAVALEGFGELADTLRAARRNSATPGDELGRVAAAFSSFAAKNPAVYPRPHRRVLKRFWPPNCCPLPAGRGQGGRQTLHMTVGGRVVHAPPGGPSPCGVECRVPRCRRWTVRYDPK